MTDESNDKGQKKASTTIEPNFRGLEFPSDALSVKRLRYVFPEHFDGSDDTIADGYRSNDFFYPSGINKPVHLARLTDLICDERVIAAGAYSASFLDRYPGLLNDEAHEAIAGSRKRLEENYLFFKLADSPETARFLIRQIEQEAQNQALSARENNR